MFARLPLLLTVAVVVTVVGMFGLFHALNRSASSLVAAPPARKSSPTKTPNESKNRREVAARITRYLNENFGPRGQGITWFDDLDLARLSVVGDTVRVRTHLAPKQSSPNRVADVCGGVSGWVFANSNSDANINTVEVLDRRGHLLVARSGYSGSCIP